MDEQVLDTQEVQQVTPEVAPQSTPRVSKFEENLTEMRKRLDAEETARKAAENKARQLEERYGNVTNVSQSAPQTVEEEDLLVDNEDYVQGKHIRTTNKKLKTQLSATEQKLADLEKKLSYFEAKIDTGALGDFDQVVSEDNLKTLARLYPDDYTTLMQNPNLKSKSKTAYNMIKNYGIYNDEVRNQENSAKIAANTQKPRAAALVSPQAPQTPLARLDEYGRRQMSEDEAARIMKEVERKKLSWG